MKIADLFAAMLPFYRLIKVKLRNLDVNMVENLWKIRRVRMQSHLRYSEEQCW